MATADDGGSDGRRRNYLKQPETYRAIDPDLFDAMLTLHRATNRSLQMVEAASVLPDARYYSRLLQDAITEREAYFRDLWRCAQPASVIFFDPDNGLEIKSRPKGRKDSSKFLYLDELETAGRDARSVIVYQHFGRVERTQYLERQLSRVADVLPAHDISAISGSHVAFLVAAAPETAETIKAAVHGLACRWPRLTTMGA